MKAHRDTYLLGRLDGESFYRPLAHGHARNDEK